MLELLLYACVYVMCVQVHRKHFYCDKAQKGMHQTIRILACEPSQETQDINLCYSCGS